MNRLVVAAIGRVAPILALSLACRAAEPDPPPYLNPDLPVDHRVADLLGRFTIEEKAQFLDHKGATITRFNIRSDQWNQCLNGVQWNQPTTLFPTCIAMAATWNPPLVKQVATALSDEARAIYNGWHQDPNFKGDKKGLIYRAPVINIGRNPYWGRTHEIDGEDPFLTGRMAVAYVQGLQGDDPRYLKLAATLKHFAVNNVETDRQKLNARVPERWLREYWLPHFRDAVVEGGACSLMASYNAINGTPNNINRWLLTAVLKQEWGHEGFVVSDLGGVKTMVEGHGANKMDYVDAVAQSLMAGCDFSDKEYAKHIPAAVAAGKLTLARLDDAVRRVLRVRMRLGEFDPPERVPWSKLPLSVIDSPAHRALALEISRQSIVLLQNHGDLLPLDKAKLKRVAVLGPHADRVTTNNYNGKFRNGITPLQGLRDRLPAGCEIVHTTGAVFGGQPHPWTKTAALPQFDPVAEVRHAADLARQADVAVVFVGTTAANEHEARDRTSLGLPGNQEELVKAVVAANPRTIVVQMSAGPLTVPWLKEHVPGMLQAWWPGEEGGHAIAEVLFGDANPAGRLPHTVYAAESQVPPLDEYDISKGFTYMYLNGEPLYPFGHGLSYTRFHYGDLKLSADTMPAGGTVTATVEVTNTGSRAGDEVVQLYTHAVAPSVKRPAKELRGFSRITLQPGAKATVTFTVPAAKLAFWDEKTHTFLTEPGAYQLLAGSSSADIRATAVVRVE
jgi:beta-glucosidase